MIYSLSSWQHYKINKLQINSLKYTKYDIQFVVDKNNCDASYRSTIRQFSSSLKKYLDRPHITKSFSEHQKNPPQAVREAWSFNSSEVRALQCTRIESLLHSLEAIYRYKLELSKLKSYQAYINITTIYDSTQNAPEVFTYLSEHCGTQKLHRPLRLSYYTTWIQ